MRPSGCRFFFGSATKPCGPCIAPQSGLVASALSCCWHSEEPQVVVTRATRTTKNSTGHRAQSTGFCWFIFGDLFRRNNVTSATTSERHRAKGVSHPGRAVPRCRPTPKPRRNYSHSGHRVPSASSFQGCDRSPVLQILRAPWKFERNTCPVAPDSLYRLWKALQRRRAGEAEPVSGSTFKNSSDVSEALQAHACWRMDVQGRTPRPWTISEIWLNMAVCAENSLIVSSKVGWVLGEETGCSNHIR